MPGADEPLRTAPEALLHLLELAHLQENPNNVSIGDAWGAALDAEFGDAEFARRHTMVTQLWRQTVHMVDTLPDSNKRTRDVFKTHEYALWRMIVSPDDPFVNPIGRAFDRVALNTLAQSVDTLSFRYGPSPSVGSTNDYLAGMRASIDNLRQTTAAAPITEPMRQLLFEKLDELEWVINNADRFGKAPIESSGFEVSSRSRAAGIAVQEDQSGQSFAEESKKLLAWTVLLEQAGTAVGGMFRLTEKVGKQVQKAIEEIKDDED